MRSIGTRTERASGGVQAGLDPAGRDGIEAEYTSTIHCPVARFLEGRRFRYLCFERALLFLKVVRQLVIAFYRCLRSYKNKFEHDLLDRQLGASLLRFLLTGAEPILETNRLEQSTDLLFEDLKRQGVSGITLERNRKISVPGLGNVVAPISVSNDHGLEIVIALHGPLTPDYPSSERLRELKEFSIDVPMILIDELVVRRNLPSATSAILAQVVS